MAKFKHNKLKNTGMLFEFLLRQVTVDVLNKKKTSKAVQIIKKRFNENTEVGKELGLYNLLLKKKFEDDKKADFFLHNLYIPYKLWIIYALSLEIFSLFDFFKI